jgi:hypothetical protein
MSYKVLVQNWNYHSGWVDVPFFLYKNGKGPTKEFREDLVGWHCWVYVYPEQGITSTPNIEEAFLAWMDTNMKGRFEADWRFNSGDPVYTIHITDEEDATLFKLRWL